MKVAMFIGTDAGEPLLVRAGRALTVWTQKGDYDKVIHFEAILVEHEDGTVDIGSSTLRKEGKNGGNGVRIKEKVRLVPENWIIVDMPMWDATESKKWFVEHDGEPYDLRGAFASPLPIWWSTSGHWWCLEAVLASVGVKSPDCFTCSSGATMLTTFGKVQ